MPISRKIGPHIIGSSNIPIGTPTVVKVVDADEPFIAQLRAILGPKPLLVVRWFEPVQPLTPPEQRAREWFNKRLAAMRALKKYAPIAFEGYNEIGDASASAYCALEVERLRLMHQESLSAVVGNFSVGTPREDLWATYKPMLDAMGANDYLGLHEYWTDRADIQNPWHVCRFALPTVWNYVKSKNILITECGRDIVEGRGKAGWRLTCSAEEFLGDLEIVGQLYNKYPNVIGATVFQAGSPDITWKDFDIAPIWPSLVSRYESQWPTAPAAPSPSPAPTGKIALDPWVITNQRPMTAEEFAYHVRQFRPPKGIVLHHTATAKARWSYSTLLNVKAYYESLGWTVGPHLFIGDEGIWLFTPLDRDGAGVSGHNEGMRHMEMIGTYDDKPPSGALWDNVLSAIVAMCSAWGLNPSTQLYFHRDFSSSKTCPGKAVRKDEVLARVWERLAHTPSTDAATMQAVFSGDERLMAQKARWWVEEALRLLERGNLEHATRILRELAYPSGLLYALEGELSDNAK